MRREDLINKLTRNLGVTRKEGNEIVDLFFNSIMDAVKNDERVEIRGFGSFSLRSYDKRQGRNPKTGEIIEVKPKKKPFFKAGKSLKDELNDKSE